MSFGAMVLVTVIVTVLVFGFALIKETFNEKFKIALDFFKNNLKRILIGLGIFIVALICIISAVSSSNKKKAIAEIENQINAVIDEAYEGEYAQEYGLKNIEFYVEDIGKYLSERYACITINCEIEKEAYLGYKEWICKEILRTLPDTVTTSTYGDIRITSIIYTPSNPNINYGVSIYLNGEQILKHGKTFDELEDESRWREEYKKEKEFESKYYAYSEYYEAKEYVENNW